MSLFRSLIFALSALASVASTLNCPILGPVFSPPMRLDSSALQNAFQNLTEILNQAIAVGNSTHGPVDNNTSYAVQFFSSYGAEPAFEWYFTPPSIRNGSFGTKNVDGNSIFRIGSITKLFTAYALLAELGDTYWDQSVAQVLPELDMQAQESDSNPINFLQWKDVTLGALASHLAGVTRQLDSSGGLSTYLPAALLTQFGLPSLSTSDNPPCLENATFPCNSSQFLAALATRQPIYAPNTTPIYSNTGYQILALALERIVGLPISEIFQKRIFSPLSLSNTFASAPTNNSRGVIPGNPGSSGWNYAQGKASGYSGIYASASDLAKTGKSILNSALVSPNVTRAWLKPVAHTSSMTLSIGRPWEIARVALDPPYDHVTDLYAKTGSENSYTSGIALLPDYNAGWVSLASGTGAQTFIDEFVIDTVIPHMETAAREQASSIFAGMYTASGINSSMTLSTEPNVPGLLVTNWTSNGTDALAAYAAIAGASVDDVTLVLQPTNLESRISINTNGTEGTVSSSRSNVKQIAFRAIYKAPPSFPDSGPYAEICTDWASMDGVTYGNFAIDQFIITVATDEHERERAQSINPRFLHVTLNRED